MDTDLILQLVKANLGMNTSLRDAYLTKLIEGIITELTEEKGIALDGSNSYHLMFIVDYAVWRFLSKDSDAGMPEHLRYRLKNLYIHAGGGASV